MVKTTNQMFSFKSVVITLKIKIPVKFQLPHDFLSDGICHLHHFEAWGLHYTSLKHPVAKVRPFFDLVQSSSE
jgi:hypothetical protein